MNGLVVYIVFAVLSSLVIVALSYATLEACKAKEYRRGWQAGYDEFNAHWQHAGKTFHAPCGCRMELCRDHEHSNGPDAWIERKEPEVPYYSVPGGE